MQKVGDAGALAWSSYWASGQQDSFFRRGKPLETSVYWTPFFDMVPEKARLIDLGCGAGALTRLAAAHPRSFSVVGADYAASLPDVPGARLDPGVRMEALPYEAGSFDVAVSQFGIEYSDMAQSLSEVARVLVRGGWCAFLIHAREGAAVAAAQAKAVALAKLLEEDGLVRAVELYGAALRQAKTAPPSPEPVAAVFRRTAPVATDEASAWAVQFLSEVMRNALRFEPAYVINNAGIVRNELSGQLQRLELMIAAARSETRMQELVAQSNTVGLEQAQIKPVVDIGGDHIAWWFRGVRGA